jgi:hypothetical protein
VEKNIDKHTIFHILSGVGILGENDEIISFGPLFGEEALLNFMECLKKINLEYVDDFFDLNFLTPDWMKIGVDAV